MNDSLDEVLATLNTLICDYGAYHINLDLSRSNITLRFANNPFICRLYGVNEIINHPFSLTYARQPYLTHARISQDAVSIVLGRLAVLCMTKDPVRLAAASLNTIEGLVSLTFSDDASYRMSSDEFLNGFLHLECRCSA
jgi:hypothetical protein